MPDALEFPLTRRTVAGLLLVFASFFPVGSSHAQTSLPQDPSAKAESKPVQAIPPVANGTGNTSEVTSRDTAATFKVRVNLVLVRVVVRDALGKVVTGLKKEDFQLSDNRKAQTISTFSVLHRSLRLPFRRRLQKKRRPASRRRRCHSDLSPWFLTIPTC